MGWASWIVQASAAGNGLPGPKNWAEVAGLASALCAACPLHVLACLPCPTLRTPTALLPLSCQSMNYLAAMLLLVLGQDEENAFWVLACLIDDQDEGGWAGLLGDGQVCGWLAGQQEQLPVQAQLHCKMAAEG